MTVKRTREAERHVEAEASLEVNPGSVLVDGLGIETGPSSGWMTPTACRVRGGRHEPDPRTL